MRVTYELERDDHERAWSNVGSLYGFACYRQVDELFRVPNSIQRIWAVLADKPVRGAVKLDLVFDSLGLGYVCVEDGDPLDAYTGLTCALRNLGGTAWAWIEYEVSA